MAPQIAAGQGAWGPIRRFKTIAEQSDLKLVALRPPLFYGPATPCRFAQPPRPARGGWLVPLAGPPAWRSVSVVDTLLEATELALEHPAAAKRCLSPEPAE